MWVEYPSCALLPPEYAQKKPTLMGRLLLIEEKSAFQQLHAAAVVLHCSPNSLELIFR